MSIQISENKLSPEARKALQNAKSKSQFMRDAIEFYVKHRGEGADADPQIKNDIRDIKEMLTKLSSGKEVPLLKQQTALEERKPDTVLVEQNQKMPESTQDEPKRKVDRTVPNNDIDDDQKKEIERLLDASINNF